MANKFLGEDDDSAALEDSHRISHRDVAQRRTHHAEEVIALNGQGCLQQVIGRFGLRIELQALSKTIRSWRLTFSRFLHRPRLQRLFLLDSLAPDVAIIVESGNCRSELNATEKSRSQV